MSEALDFHKKFAGKIEVIARTPIHTLDDLKLAYTPGVAEPCLEIARDKSLVYTYTRKHNMVAVVTDGSAVLGLGNIGPEAGLPVMEGKCVLFKEFADIDAFPIALDTQDVDEIVRTVEIIAPMFGGINLEDISAPRCFEVEKRLKEKLSIPVFHDDQHGTAIVVLAGLYNALKVTGKTIADIQVVMSGAGAAGTAICKLLLLAGVQHIVMTDSQGIISSARADLNDEKKELLSLTNKKDVQGTLAHAMVGADVFVGVSKPGLLTVDMVQTMNEHPIIFALANPTPEIMPDIAKQAGAAVVATGRSDFANQINNVLIFPGLFRGLLDARASKVTDEMKLAAAKALADYVETPTREFIIPSALDKQVSRVIAEAVKKCVYAGNSI